jgi:hypothetical protein
VKVRATGSIYTVAQGDFFFRSLEVMADDRERAGEEMESDAFRI